jgi:hypothetical protein
MPGTGPLAPTDTRPFFRPVARELVALLRGLPADAWDKPTVAGTWRVRDAVAAPPLREPQWLHAVLLIALRGLPHAYRDVPVEPGQAIAIEITGAAGGVFTLRRNEGSWSLLAGREGGESARVSMSDDTAWRLLFNALPPGRAETLVTRDGDPALLAPLLRARSVIV